MTDQLKSELNKIIPQELSMNIDFWNQISTNIICGYNYIPQAFIHYLSNKYNYDFELINSSEVRDYIYQIAAQSNNKSLDFLRQNQPVFKIDTQPSFQKFSKKLTKARKRLLQETPLAEFN
jgi:hypothetical protein